MQPFIGAACVVVFVLTSVLLLVLEKTQSPVIAGLRTAVIDVTAPAVGSLTVPVNKVKDYLSDLQSLVSLQAEMARLRQENKKMKELEEKIFLLEAHNQKLANALNFRYPKSVKYASGEVMSDSAGAFANSLIVLAGSEDGVEKGDAVLSAGVLVGRVIYAGKQASQVLLLTDVSSRVPVFVGKKRIKAILSGNNTQSPVLTEIENIEEIKPDDEIITSGISDTLPTGLKVGKTAKDYLPSGDDIKVNLYMKRNHLDILKVMNFGRTSVLQDIKCAK